MHRELVEDRRWISDGRFLHALNYCMLLPGPEAQQLATYIGWLLHRTWGGIVAGALFVLPGFLAMLVLSWIYVRYQSADVVTALFFGLKAAVLAIVVEAVVRIGKRALKNGLMVALAAASFCAIHFFDVSFPWIVIAAAAIGVAIRYLRPSLYPEVRDDEVADENRFVVDRMFAAGRMMHATPSASHAAMVAIGCLALWALPVAIAAMWLGNEHVVTKEGLFFGQAAVVTFGGAYAVLAYIAQRAVEDLHWLQPGEMLDGLALAETTPGPLIMVVQFVAFLAAYRYPGVLDPWVAAALGAAMTTWVTFLPSFLFIFVGAPYVESLRRNRLLNSALSAITAAVVGVILNLSVWFALHTVFGQVNQYSYGVMHFDVPVWGTVEPGALTLTTATLIAVLRFKVPMGWTLLGSAVVGAIYWAAT
jgi:chromate transporter